MCPACTINIFWKRGNFFWAHLIFFRERGMRVAEASCPSSQPNSPTLTSGTFFLVCLLLAARLVPLADGSIPQRGCPLGPWIIEAIYRCRILSCELCRVDLSANRNANLEARASNRTIIQPSNDSCANHRTRGSWCLPTEPRRSSGWCLGTKRVLFSCLRPCFIA